MIMTLLFLQGELSLRFELTGGFIKNAILSALSIAVSRDGDTPLISQKDLLQGANLQLRGRLRMKDFHRRVVPNKGLDKVIVSEQLMKNLKEIVQFEKARSLLLIDFARLAVILIMNFLLLQVSIIWTVGVW